MASAASMAAFVCGIVAPSTSRAFSARDERDCEISLAAKFNGGLSRRQSCRIIQGTSDWGAFRGALRLVGGSRNNIVIFASRDEIPSEILDDSKFVTITEEDPRFGPPAILLLGFTNDEAVKVQDLLKELEGDFMQALLCTEEMAKGTLGKAMNAVQPNVMQVQVAKGLPRIAFLSGLTGEEIMMMIQIFPQSGLERTVFAAHVPLNSDKSIAELTEEIMDDHRRLNKEADKVEENES